MQKIFLLITLVLLAACSAPSGLAPETGAKAPEFALLDLSGVTFRLSDFRGQVVLLNFWATWCGPCRVEMPIIQERYNDGGFAVLAINFNESPEKVQGFAEELDLNMPILLDPGGRIQELYRVRGYPSSYFVDANGTIQIIHIGEMNNETLESYLAQLGVQP